MTSQHTIGTCFYTFVSTIYPHGLLLLFLSLLIRAFCYVRHLQPVFSTCLALDMDLRCGNQWVLQAQ